MPHWREHDAESFSLSLLYFLFFPEGYNLYYVYLYNFHSSNISLILINEKPGLLGLMVFFSKKRGEKMSYPPLRGLVIVDPLH